MTRQWIGCVALMLVGVSTTVGQWSRETAATAIEPVLADPPATGLLIFDVLPESQAAKAGFKMGDILTHYDGQPVGSTNDLSSLAKEAAKAKRANLVVIVRRGNEDVQGELDAAPLGVRLIAVRVGEKRTLWRPATPYEPDFAGLAKLTSNPHRWERILAGDQPAGWAHSYLTPQGRDLVLRVQSRLKTESLDEKRDVTVAFTTTPNLAVRRLRLTSRDKLIVDLRAEGEELKGERVGVAISAPLPPDAVSSFLSPLVASTMPRAKGACLRCSFLEAASQTAAPFADLCCTGTESITIDGRPVETVRYEQTVFGEKAAEFWVDDERQVVQSLYGGRIRGVRATREAILEADPKAETDFDPIEKLPTFEGAAPKAN